MGNDIGELRQRIAWAPETTYGTESAGTYSVFGQIKGDPQLSIDNKPFIVSEAGVMNTRNILEGSAEVGVSGIDFFLQNGAAVALAIGEFDTTSPVTNTDNYKHVAGTVDSTSTYTAIVEYEPKAFTLSMGLELGVTDDVITVTGCKVNTASFTLNMNEPMSCSFDIIGKNATIATAAKSLTRIGNPSFMFHNKGEISIDSTTMPSITELSFKIENDLKRTFGILPSSEKRTITSLLPGERKINGSFRMNYQDATMLKKLLDSTASPTTIGNSGCKEITISVLLDNNETETTAAYRGLKFTLSGVKLGNVDRAFPKDGSVVNENFTFNAVKLVSEYWDVTATDPW